MNFTNDMLALLLSKSQNPDAFLALQALFRGGDPRVGGSLPLGGKAYAGSTNPANGMLLTTPSRPRAEREGHDVAMNYQEARLQDEAARLAVATETACRRSG